MIVNPQFFNYRLIIGSLTFVVASLSIFGYINYQSVEAHQDFLEQEKKLVESELVEMIDQYDKASLSNNLLTVQLKDFKTKAELALDSLKSLKTDISSLSRYKQQVVNLKVRNKFLFGAIDSLNIRNRDLEVENKITYEELQKEKSENSLLKQKNAELSRNLADASRISASAFTAKGYQKNFGLKSFTNKAKHVNSIELCFTLAENNFVKPGKKDLYVQILNPRNNIIADKGEIKFGKNKLIYSQKISAQYDNKESDICIDVEADNSDQPLAPGTYFVSVFHEGKNLGGTKVEFR
ncbi:MAG: hypothetical protein AAF688_09265 [Bacteroidota bacterium]